MNVRTKLIAGFLVIVSLILTTVFFAENSYERINQEFESMEEDIIPSAVKMSDMEEQAQEIKHWVALFIARGDESVKDFIQESMVSLERLAEEYTEHEIQYNSAEQDAATQLENNVRQLNLAASEIINMKDQGAGIDELTVKIQESFDSAYLTLTSQLRVYKSDYIEKLAESGEAIYKANTSGKHSLFLFAGLITLLAAVITFLTIRSIIKPLRILHKGTEIIGQGNLDYKVGTKAKDEIEQLSRAFDQMTENLANTTTTVDNLNQEIAIRKQIEEALRESQEKMRLVFQAAGEGIVVIDLENKITDVNQALVRMHAYHSREDLIGRNALKLSSEEDRARARDNTSRRLKEGLSGAIEYTLVRKDGSKFPATVNMSAIKDANGSPIGYIGIFADITERKQAEIEREALLEDLQKLNVKLEESNRELQDFVYVASHYLREPLRKIASFGTLLQSSLDGKLDEDQEENFKFMIDGSNRMQTMVDDLLTYSRVSTKTRPFEEVDLNSVIQDLKDVELATVLEETKATISILKALPPVNGDSPQLHQLLQNLIANGLKFRRDSVRPEITIRAQRIKNSMVHLEVQDNGIGIEEKYYEQIFTMFKRLHSRTQYEGTGIGLAVCKKIVHRHGGEIGVKSTLGEGSTFWFTLPRA